MRAWHKIDTSALPAWRTHRPDPYVAWAELTDWIDLGGRDQIVPLLVELKLGVKVKDFEPQLRRVLPSSSIAKAYLNGGRHFTVRLHPDDLATLAADASLNDSIERFELSAPVRTAASTAPTPITPMSAPAGQTLIGIVDVGFPFAHPALTVPASPRTSRIARWWAMDDSGAFGSPGSGLHTLPATMGYGHEIERSDTAGKAGLDGWLASHAGLDESTLYELAGYRRLRRRATHGAHVASLLLSTMPLRSRTALNPNDLRRTGFDSPPSWTAIKDIAADPTRSDVVLVELPRAAIHDSSGGWLGAHMIDALTWISQVGKKSARRVVTISYGSTAGPHDGSSIFEAALVALLKQDKNLELVVAAGNSFDSALHAKLSASRPTMHWQVPSGSRTPAFLQLWCEGTVKSGAGFCVQAPDAPSLNVLRGEVWALKDRHGVAAVAAFPDGPTSRGREPMALLALSPTAPTWYGTGTISRAFAPAGTWHVSGLHGLGPTVRAYAARNDYDLDAPRLGRPSSIIDSQDDPTRYLRRRRDDPALRSDDFPSQGGLVSRRGTLNGIATVDASRLRVAAGYERRASDHASYSAAGDKGLTPPGVCRSPTHAMPTDESAALRGARASGVRGASAVRLVGTSTAAPMLARALVNQQLTIRPMPIPTPGTPAAHEDLFGPNDKQPASGPAVTSVAAAAGASASRGRRRR